MWLFETYVGFIISLQIKAMYAYNILDGTELAT
jgi:hypothetical protein